SDGFARLRLLTDLSDEWRSGSELDGQFAQFEGRLLSAVAVR
ncbi:MAG: 4'-phosphopantetheinyl transferase, partial [Pseudomonas sp.]